jgi:hypothetical protein
MRFFSALYDRPVFRRELPVADKRDVIHWWESRRIFFNVVVGCVGIITCILMIVCAFVSEPIVGEAIGLPDGPLLGVAGIIAYAFFANICYSFGSASELLLRTRMTADRAATFSIHAFRRHHLLSPSHLQSSRSLLASLRCCCPKWAETWADFRISCP